MQFHEKRPVFMAEQFDGTTASMAEIGKLVSIKNYTITSDIDQTVKFEGHVRAQLIGARASLEPLQFEMLAGYWFVVEPDGTAKVMSDSEFSTRFEDVVEPLTKRDMMRAVAAGSKP